MIDDHVIEIKPRPEVMVEARKKEAEQRIIDQIKEINKLLDDRLEEAKKNRQKAE